jgi:hypothetical protein
MNPVAGMDGTLRLCVGGCGDTADDQQDMPSLKRSEPHGRITLQNT